MYNIFLTDYHLIPLRHTTYTHIANAIDEYRRHLKCFIYGWFIIFSRNYWFLCVPIYMCVYTFDGSISKSFDLFLFRNLSDMRFRYCPHWRFVFFPVHRIIFLYRTEPRVLTSVKYLHTFTNIISWITEYTRKVT